MTTSRIPSSHRTEALRAAPPIRAGRATLWIIGVVVALVIFTGCGFGLLHLLRLSASNATTTGTRTTLDPPAPDCEISLSHPQTATVGQPFEIEFTVHNPTAEIRTLASIDLGTPLPGQLRHDASSPPPTMVDESDDLAQLWFNRPIFAGDTFVVTSTVVPTDPGSLDLSLTFWFPETLALELVSTIEVAEQSARRARPVIPLPHAIAQARCLSGS